MGKVYYVPSQFSQEIATKNELYSSKAQSYVDYHGCLPSDDDAADHYRHAIRAVKVS